MATLEEQKEQQRAQWSASAPGWEKYVGWLEEQIGMVSERMLDAVRVGVGTRVLDLACGSGEPSVTAAKRGAKVTAGDLSPEMVASTKRRAASAGVEMDVRVIDLEHIEFPDGTFEVVTCRFGLMFAPSPERATAEMHRVLAANGRFALCVWDEPAKNPFFTGMGQLVQQYTNAPPPDPKAPGVFRLAAPGELERVLRAGGFTDITIEPVPLHFAFSSPQAYWDMQSELAAPLKAAIATLPPDRSAALKKAVIEMAEKNVADGKVRFGAQPLIAFGTR